MKSEIELLSNEGLVHKICTADNYEGTKPYVEEFRRRRLLYVSIVDNLEQDPNYRTLSEENQTALVVKGILFSDSERAFSFSDVNDFVERSVSVTRNALWGLISAGDIVLTRDLRFQAKKEPVDN